MAEEKGVLETYIKKGLEKGFNINYIKETLIEHGHKQDIVETAANNVMGLKYPEELKPHLEETTKQKPKKPVMLITLVVILILITSFLLINYFSNRTTIVKAQTELEEIEELGIDIDDLSSEMKTQMDLVKEKDTTIEEKEKIIQDQIKLIDEINEKIKLQRSKVKDILLDIMNRMIGRMGG